MSTFDFDISQFVFVKLLIFRNLTYIMQVDNLKG